MSEAASSPSAEPALTPEGFAAFMKALDPAWPMAVAVSGGGDSTALMHLAAAWAVKAKVPAGHGQTPLTVLTVDHGLRPGSDAEARQVAAWAHSLNLPCEILAWQGAKPQSDVQAAARAARYRLMGQWCADHGVRCLLTGHTLDDQAETVLLRLGRGSGVDGLAAMSPEVSLDVSGAASVRLLRPLIRVRREALREYLRGRNLPWLEDPSNDDLSFSRVKARRLMPLFEELGLTPERLARTADHMARAKRALEAAVSVFLQAHSVLDESGHITFDATAFAGLEKEIGLRALVRMLRIVAGAAYAPRFERLERLYGRLVAGGLGKGVTLGGCHIRPADGGRGPRHNVLIVREARGLGADIALGPGQARIWDGRFEVFLAQNADPGSVRAVGEEGLAQLRGASCRAEAKLPQIVALTLPSLWRGHDLVCVPHLGFDPDNSGFSAVFRRNIMENDGPISFETP